MKPWSYLTTDERRRVQDTMTRSGGVSVNGVAGWYHTARNRHAGSKHGAWISRFQERTIPATDMCVPDEMAEILEIEEISDILPEKIRKNMF